jgi:hypothetical protein
MIGEKETTNEQGWCYRLKNAGGRATAKRFRPSNGYHKTFKIVDYTMTSIIKSAYR